MFLQESKVSVSAWPRQGGAQRPANAELARFRDSFLMGPSGVFPERNRPDLLRAFIDEVLTDIRSVRALRPGRLMEMGMCQVFPSFSRYLLQNPKACHYLLDITYLQRRAGLDDFRYLLSALRYQLQRQQGHPFAKTIVDIHAYKYQLDTTKFRIPFLTARRRLAIGRICYNLTGAFSEENPFRQWAEGVPKLPQPIKATISGDKNLQRLMALIKVNLRAISPAVAGMGHVALPLAQVSGGLSPLSPAAARSPQDAAYTLERL